MPSWLLFVDESGRFDDPTDPVVVGGWLVRAYDSPQLGAALREWVAAALPTIPYPPHAAHLDIPVSRALYAARIAQPSNDAERLLVEKSVPAIRALERAPAPYEQAFAASRASGTLPEVRELRALDAWLSSRHPRAWSALAAMRDHDERQRMILHDLLGAATDAKQSFAVGAFERGAATGQSDRARYEALLQACLERALTLLAPRRGELSLQLRVSRRSLFDGNRWRELDRGLAQDLASRACARVGVKPGTIVVRTVERYDAETHPGIVIADHLVNRLRRQASRSPTWPILAQRFKVTTGLACEGPVCRLAPDALLPAVTATGIAHATVLASLRDESVDAAAFAQEVPGWVPEQARSWLAEAKEWHR